MTSRGLKENDFKLIGKLIAKALKNKDNKDILKEVSNNVIELTNKYPINQ